jgi:hypothetical protein
VKQDANLKKKKTVTAKKFFPTDLKMLTNQLILTIMKAVMLKRKAKKVKNLKFPNML